MARHTERLTDLAVRRARKLGRYADGRGLCLQVSGSGAKSWLFRYGRHGRERWAGLGPYPDIPLVEARQKALECRRALLNGVDPIEAKRSARLAAKLEEARELTFESCAQRYIAAHEPTWRNPKHRAQWPSTLERYVYPIFGALPVGSVDTALVLKAIEPIWTKKPETASRVRERIEAVLDWATAREFRQGENPARWRGHLDKLLPPRARVRKEKHHSALPYAELPDFMAALRRQDGVAARALEFLILTAARTSEVIGASRPEIWGKTWTVPAERMKGRREHRVPLQPAALAIVETMIREHTSEFVFAGGRPGKPLSQMALAMTLRRMERSDLTVHGFRSTFRDWAAERTGFPREAAEAALAHVIPDKVEAAYRRGDLFERRQQLMQAWDRYCASGAVGPTTVGLRRAG